MVQNRNRERRRTAAAGTSWEKSTGVIGGPYPYTQSVQKTFDQIKKKKNTITGLTPVSPFDSLNITYVPTFFSSDYYYNGELLSYKHGIPCYAGSEVMGSPSIGWPAIEGTAQSNVAQLLANTNPFRYTVSVPIMVTELIDAGSLLRISCRNALSIVGSSYLNWNFGWKLMMNDIRTLASITTAIESRIKEFNSIVQTGGLRRRVFICQGSHVDSSTGTIYSAPSISRTADMTTTYTSKVWGSVRWVPNRASPIDLTKLATFNEACKIVLDLQRPDPSTIWEAIPFSWLVDYFLNVGNALKAVERSDLVLPTDICIMKHRIAKTVYKGNPYVNVPGPQQYSEHFDNGFTVYDRKYRETQNPNSAKDLLSFGFMTKGQATNLMALLFSLNRFRKPIV
jgi:hypothetical protein